MSLNCGTHRLAEGTLVWVSGTDVPDESFASTRANLKLTYAIKMILLRLLFLTNEKDGRRLVLFQRGASSWGNGPEIRPKEPIMVVLPHIISDCICVTNAQYRRFTLRNKATIRIIRSSYCTRLNLGFRKLDKHTVHYVLDEAECILQVAGLSSHQS